MASKTLIVYSTRTGINAKAAHAIAEALKTQYAMDVMVEELKNGPPDIKPYLNIIVGGGVSGTTVYDEAIDFLGRDFGGKNVALYFCCEDYETPKTESTEENTRKALAKNKTLKPIDVTAFGGCVIKRGGPTLDELNMQRVHNWAIEIGKKFSAPMLSRVPPDNEFRFFADLEKNTGATASSTSEFAEKLQTVPIESVTFHFQRQDFQRWFKNSVDDEELAKRIDHINIWDQGENLRKELSDTVQNRIAELSKAS